MVRTVADDCGKLVLSRKCAIREKGVKAQQGVQAVCGRVWARVCAHGPRLFIFPLGARDGRTQGGWSRLCGMESAKYCKSTHFCDAKPVCIKHVMPTFIFIYDMNIHQIC